MLGPRASDVVVRGWNIWRTLLDIVVGPVRLPPQPIHAHSSNSNGLSLPREVREDESQLFPQLEVNCFERDQDVREIVRMLFFDLDDHGE